MISNAKIFWILQNDMEAMIVTTAEFRQVYWRYYLILEKDVLGVEPYVSFHPDNYNCFSNEFIKLYQTICSEIDVICKEYCKYIEGTTSITGEYRNIRSYAKYILTHHPEIVKQNVYVLADSGFELIPWKGWQKVTPEWWSKYNDIKHRRSDKDDTGKYNYQYASLYNVLNALAALNVLEKYFYADLARSDAFPGKTPNIVIKPESRLFGLLDSEREYLALMGLVI